MSGGAVAAARTRLAQGSKPRSAPHERPIAPVGIPAAALRAWADGLRRQRRARPAQTRPVSPSISPARDAAAGAAGDGARARPGRAGAHIPPNTNQHQFSPWLFNDLFPYSGGTLHVPKGCRSTGWLRPCENPSLLFQHRAHRSATQTCIRAFGRRAPHQSAISLKGQFPKPRRLTPTFARLRPKGTMRFGLDARPPAPGAARPSDNHIRPRRAGRGWRSPPGWKLAFSE